MAQELGSHHKMKTNVIPGIPLYGGEVLLLYGRCNRQIIYIPNHPLRDFIYPQLSRLAQVSLFKIHKTKIAMKNIF